MFNVAPKQCHLDHPWLGMVYIYNLVFVYGDDKGMVYDIVWTIVWTLW